MSTREQALEDAEVLLEGEFKLDRARAMDKLARFQLEEPHRYVLELLAAAIRGGAQFVEILNDADDFVIEWEGDTPSPAELEQLFEHIFLREGDDRSRMLQHLAQGLHAALALKPRWLHFERPGARFEMDSSGALHGSPHDRSSGTRIHLRERLSLDMLREWLGTPRETWLLQEFAAHAPIPLILNGEAMERARPPADQRPRAQQGHSCIWLEVSGASPGVALIRDGLRIEHLPIQLGPLQLTGWWHADALRLNASRSKVARRADLRPLRTHLLKSILPALEQHLDHPRGHFERAQIQLAALALVAELGRKHLDSLGDRPLFLDLTGRSFSLEALASHKKIWLTSRPGLASRLERAPQFLEGEGQDPMDRNSLQLAALQARFPGRLINADAALRDNQEGEARRSALLRADPELPFTRGLPEHFSGPGGLIGSASVLGGGSVARVEFWVDELPVETLAVNLPAGLGLRVGGPGLRADRRFEKVERDAAFKAAQELALEQGRQYLLHLAEHHAADPDVAALLRDWLVRLAPRGALDALDPALAQAPLFTDGLGQRRSVRELAAWLKADGRIEIAAGEPAGAPFPRTIATDDSARRTLRACFGHRALLDLSQRIEDHRHAQLRRAAALPRPMRLERHLIARVPVAAEGLYGELGLSPVEDRAFTQIQLFRSGVDLGTLLVDLGVPGTLAILSWEGLEPDARWEAPAHPERDRRTLARLLKPFVAPLLQGVLGALPLPSERMPAWVGNVLDSSSAAIEPLLQAPLFLDASGGTWSVVELEARALGARIPVLGPGSPRVPDRLRHALLLDGPRYAALRRRMAESLWDASLWLEQWHQARTAFFERAPLPPWREDSDPGLRRFSHQGLELQILPADAPSHTQGLKLSLLFEGRPLQTLVLPSAVPARARLSGPALLPDDRYAGTQDPENLSLLRSWWAADCLEQCIQDWLPDVRLPRAQRLLLLGQVLDLQPAPPGLAALKAAPLINTPRGDRASYDQLLQASARGALLLISPRLAALVPDDDRLWVIPEPSLRPLLARLPSEPLDGDLELSRLDEGRRNRARARITPLWQPGPWEAAARFTAGPAALFVCIAPHPKDAQRIWRVEGRSVQSDRVPEWPPELQVHVEHPELRANTAFNAVVDAPLLAELRTLGDQAVAALLAALCGVADPRLSELQVPRPEAIPRTLLRYGASRPRVDALWGEHPLVSDSQGRPLSARDLRTLGRRGIPVISSGRIGPGLDPERPLIPATQALRDLLERWGRLQDAESDWQAARERDRRMAMAPVQRSPAQNAPWVHPLSPPHQGFVQAGVPGAVLELLHQGRPLCTLDCAGPVPLSGAVEDTRILPNLRHDAPEQGPALTALQQHLTELSRQALQALLVAPDALPLSQWVPILQRALPRNRDRRGKGRNPELATLPLFPTGDGERLSLAQLHDMPGEPRWVTADHATPSLEPEHPFLVVPSGLMLPLIEWLGGHDAQSEARAEAARLRSRRAKGLEGSDKMLHSLQRSLTPGELHLGLRRGFGQGWVDVRCDGIPVTRLDFPLPGLSGALEVGREHLTRGLRDLREPKPFRYQITQAYAELIAAAAPRLREGGLLRWEVTRLLSTLKQGPAAKAWRAAPLLDGPSGPLSPEQAAKGCVWSPQPIDGAVCVYDSRANRGFLEALGIRPLEPVAWAALQQRRRSKAAKAATAVDSGWQKRVVKRSLAQLSAGLRLDRALRKRVLGRSIPTQLDTEPKLLRFTWEALDRELARAERWQDCGLVAVRAVGLL